MKARATHLLLLFDYAIGMFFAFAILALGVVGIALTGMPTSYEKRALGSVYTEFLARVEKSARGLRAEYCATANDVARAEANCPESVANAGAAAA
jgi:hypothetical protein